MTEEAMIQDRDQAKAQRQRVDGPIHHVPSSTESFARGGGFSGGGGGSGYWKAAHDGMTLRQYFAAHAPTEVPQWFSVEEATLPTELTRREAVTIVCTQRGLPISTEGVNHIANNMGDMWPEEDAPEGSPPDDDQSIAWAALQLINQRRELIATMHNENRANRYFTWRWHYADTMIKIGGF